MGSAEPERAAAPVIVAAPQNLVRGFVHEAGKQEGVANAIISFQGGVQPPVATGPDGRFLTRHLEPGGYTFDVVAPGFKPGTCAATVVAAPPPQAAPMQPGMPGSFTPPPAPAAGPTIASW